MQGFDATFDLKQLSGLNLPGGLNPLDALGQTGLEGLKDLDLQQLLGGTETWMDKLPDAMKQTESPDNAQLMQMLQELIQLLTMLLQQGAAPGQEGTQQAGGAPAGGGGAPAGGGGAPAGGGASPAGGGGSKGGAPSAGTENVDGPGGFLWKPASESDGNLVVLLPPELKGNVDSVRIEDASGNTVASGRFAGDNKNGGRPHFRFDKPGAAFGNNVRAVATTKDGREVSFNINRGAARND